MTEREKELLRYKYGHSKWLLAVHCLGKYIKDIYHPSASSKRLILFGENNRVPYVPEECRIQIFGKNNTVEIDPSVKTWHGHIKIGEVGSWANDCCVRIGKKKYI